MTQPDFSADVIKQHSDKLLAFIKEHENYLFSAAKGVVKFDSQAAEACVNEARMNIVSKIDTFRGSTEAELRSWMRTTVVRACLVHLRKQKNNLEKPLGEQDPAANAGTPSQAMRLEEEQQNVGAMLDELLDVECEALLYKYFEEWTIDQIAKQLDRTPSAVGGILHRAMTKLRAGNSPSDWSRLLSD